MGPFCDFFQQSLPLVYKGSLAYGVIVMADWLFSHLHLRCFSDRCGSQCKSLWILACLHTEFSHGNCSICLNMSRSTHNSQDAALFPSVSSATSSAAVNSSSSAGVRFEPVGFSGYFSAVPRIKWVRVALAVNKPPCLGWNCRFYTPFALSSAHMGIPAQNSGLQASASLASGTGFAPLVISCSTIIIR